MSDDSTAAVASSSESSPPVALTQLCSSAGDIFPSLSLSKYSKTLSSSGSSCMKAKEQRGRIRMVRQHAHAHKQRKCIIMGNWPTVNKFKDRIVKS
ncbi:hypothetical protein F8388_011185 [Cannabis sativa]|uniref:Uncharacterized protein n=1 Tax=Cannabis sativa TaxID=3483 RepID=A0A7J6ERX4_CANSA|nr:hypothetical protein F8388_011185 [Cannabis sativa]